MLDSFLYQRQKYQVAARLGTKISCKENQEMETARRFNAMPRIDEAKSASP